MAIFKLRSVKRAVLFAVATIGLAASTPVLAACAFGGDLRYSASDLDITANRLADGVAVSGWQSGAEEFAASCSRDSSTVRVSRNANVAGTYKIGHTTYDIIKTSVPGLGVIAEFQVPQRPGWHPLTGDRAISVIAASAGVDIAVDLRFVKYADIAEGDYTVHELQLASYQVTDGLGGSAHGTLRAPEVALRVVYAPVCRPAATAVAMPDTVMTRLPAEGSAGPTRRFDIVVDCEKDVGEFRYFIEDAGSSTVVDTARGLYSVTGGAKGVALQMLEAGGRVIGYREVRPFGNTMVAGEQRKSFEARYVRTARLGSEMEAGDANASLRIVMDYP